MRRGDDLALGSRIAVRGNHRGTILFIGSVPGHSGDWAGVEWDDGTRGKHDGSIEGRRLFTCRKGGAPATFVRLSKLKEALIDPISILDGIKLRYCAASIPVAERDRQIQVAGLDKLVDEASDLSTLEHASLCGMNVAAKVGRSMFDLLCWTFVMLVGDSILLPFVHPEIFHITRHAWSLLLTPTA